jgi:hypothetical protein
MTLLDLLTAISFLEPIVASVAVARNAKLGLLSNGCLVVGGIALGFGCAWVLYVAIPRLMLPLIEPAAPRTNFAQRAINVVAGSLIFAWAFGSLAFGYGLANLLARILS